MGEVEVMDLALLVDEAGPVSIPLAVVIPFVGDLRNAISVEVSTTGEITRVKQSVSSSKTGIGSTKLSTTVSSVSLSTSIQRVADIAPAPTDIPALSAVTQHTGAANVVLDDIYPIVTRLKPDAWEAALKDAGVFEQFSDIPEGLRKGFLCGLERFSLASTFIPDNHYTSEHDESFIISKYAEEIELGRVSKGYDPAHLFSLIGHYRTAPLAVIEQSPGKFRVIVNHSYPQNKISIDLNTLPLNPPNKIILDPSTTSINTVVNSKNFQCTWGSFSECYLLVADAPPHTQAAVFDVDAAFRNVPTHPSARRFLAIKIKDLIHLDHVCNFGATPAPGLWGKIADAMVKILLFHGIDALIKWVDDFIFFRYPRHSINHDSLTYSYNAELIWNIAEELGWPWARSKFIDFTSSFQYIGFWWDLASKTVELPDKKKTKYLARLLDWTPGSFHTAKDAERLIGTLNHITLVVPEGRTHLVSLYKFRGGFKSDTPASAKHKLPSPAVLDIDWWRNVLLQPFVGLNVIRPPKPLNIELFVDASTSWGIGLVLNGRWLAWELKDGWKSDGRDIGWAEMVAVELAMRTLVTASYSDCHIVVRSDNMGVVGAIAAGRSRGTQQNAILCEIVKFIQARSIWLSTLWIPTLENPADGSSRGVFPSRSLLYAHPPRIPFHLCPFVHKSVDYHDPRVIVNN
jgi:hypothetical protein